MSEYLEREQNGVVVRIHRRVPAGLQRESANDFLAVLLGTISADGRRVEVQDFATLEPGAEFDPESGSLAGQPGFSLPAVGYCRVGPGEEISLADRELWERRSRAPLKIFAVFEKRESGIRWASVHVQPEPAAPRPESPEHLVLFREEEAAAESAEPDVPITKREWFLPAVAAVVCFLAAVVTFLPRDKPAEPAHARPAAARTGPAAAAPIPAGARGGAPITPSNPGDSFPSEADRAVNPSGPGNAADRARVQAEVGAVLERWREAMLRQDVDGYASLYAPTVGPYFNKSRVSRAEIADEVRRMAKRYGPVTSYRITGLMIAPTDENHAIADFRKNWTTAGNRFSGLERAQMKFEKRNADWLITSEQELKVYWVHRK